MMSSRFRSGLFLCTVLFVGACATQSAPSKAPVRMGSAQGEPIPPGSSVAQADGYDPVKQHMLARRDVDPVHVNKKNRYTKTVAEMKAEKRGPFRELRLEPKMAENQPLKAALDSERIKRKREEVLRARDIAPAAGVTGQPIVSGIRTGAHPGKTRLVLDVNEKTPFTTTLQNGGRVLIVDMPAAQWNVPAHNDFAGDPLVDSYQIKGVDSGTQFIISLKKPARLAAKMALPPNSTYNNHRIVLDVAAL